MKRIGVRDFHSTWRKIETAVEVYNRDTHVGTWIPAGETLVGWLDDVPAHRSEIPKAFRGDEADPKQISGVEAAKNRQKARDALLNAAFSRKTAKKP